jgi:sugar phosphate isomerase/epimerase
MHGHHTSKPQTRRHFLQLAGAAAGLAASSSFGQTPAPAQPSTRQSAPRKERFVLGLASYTFKDFPLDQTLAMTARVGLTHICLKSFHLPLEAKPDQIAKAAEQVKKSGIELYGGGVISMKTAAEVEQAFNYAKAAGMKTIVGVPYPDVLPLVNEKVQQYDICVAIHNHGPGDKVYPAPQDAYDKIRQLDKRIGLCIDIGHTLRYGIDPAEATRKFADRLLDIHIKDVSAAAASGKTVEIGRGVIDIPKFLRTLIEINYSGVAAFEFEKDPKDPLAGLAESVGYVRGVLAAI